MEWTELTVEQIAVMLVKSRPYFVTLKYKTVKTYGGKAKFLLPGTIAVLQSYMRLPGKTRPDMVPQPARPETKGR
eukprot:1765212-Lingulodinium_polyedra.AAC.1